MGMKQILGKLAGQTAIYGTSTIVARFLNYMLLPLYTYTLSTADYGVLTEFMSYISPTRRAMSPAGCSPVRWPQSRRCRRYFSC